MEHDFMYYVCINQALPLVLAGHVSQGHIRRSANPHLPIGIQCL